MIFFRNILLILILALSFSCKKRTYPNDEINEQTIFNFNASIDGRSFSINAGKEDYYLYSSYGQDGNGVYYFTSDLRKNNCSGDCPKSIKIRINDFKISQIGGRIKIDSSLVPKSYPLQAGNIGYEAHFLSTYNKTAASYHWDFGDGLSSNVSDPIHYYSRPGIYKVDLRITSTGGCISDMSNMFKIGYSPTALTCAIKTTSIVGSAIDFTAVSNGSVTYFWDFGDGNSSTLASPSHTFANIGSYPIMLRTISANDTAIAHYNAVTQNDNSSCAANYSLSAQATVTDSPFPSNITIDWTDENGVLYTSNNVLQPATSSFKIISVESFEPNEKGEKTKKLKVSFKCRVYNGTNYKTIDGGEAVLCVSYK
jgi:PKD repeat protein